MDEVGTGHERVRSLVFAGVVVDPGGLFGRATRAAAFTLENVDDIVVRLIELRLSEIGKEMLVAAVAVHDDDFLAAVARHFVGSFLEELKLKRKAVGDGSGLLFGLEDLTEVILGKNDGVLLLDGVKGGIADVEQIGAEREMGPVLFEDTEGKQARALSLLHAFAKIRGGELFPMSWGVCLGPPREGRQQSEAGHKSSSAQHSTSS